MKCNLPLRHQQKSRAELVEEIVGEFKRRHQADLGYPIEEELWLRQILVRVSDISMDAVEVEEIDVDETGLFEEDACRVRERTAYNAARTASQAKRTLFVK